MIVNITMQQLNAMAEQQKHTIDALEFDDEDDDQAALIAGMCCIVIFTTY